MYVQGVRLAAIVLLAATPAVSYVPAPPGTVITQTAAYLGGHALDSRYRVVSSRVMVGRQDGKPAYQWYLTVYAPAGNRYVQSWQSPGGTSTLLSRVTKANGAERYFPSQTLGIVGTARLMSTSAQQVIVRVREIGADCGTVSVAILAADPKRDYRVGPAATITNPCDLDTKTAPDGASLQLIGPYYGPNAPLCCPTKAQATAVLRYRNGSWSESPNYFKIERTGG